MQWLDAVRVTTDKYESEGVKKGDIGVIILPEIRANTYEVVFSDKDGRDYAQIEIFVGDLELATRNEDITDESILEDLPGHDPNWWCKVEDGYILNLKGEQKQNPLRLRFLKPGIKRTHRVCTADTVRSLLYYIPGGTAA